MTAKKTTKPTTKKYTGFGWNYHVGRGVHYTQSFLNTATMKDVETFFHTLFRRTAEENDPMGEGDNIWLVSIVEGDVKGITHYNQSESTDWHGYTKDKFSYYIAGIAIELPFLHGEVEATNRRVAKAMVTNLITEKSAEFAKNNPDIAIDVERLLTDLQVDSV